MPMFQKNNLNLGFLISILLFGIAGGLLSGVYFYGKISDQISSISNNAQIVEYSNTEIVEKEYVPQTTQEEKIISVVEESIPSVVSIVGTKEVPVYTPTYDDFLQEFFPEFFIEVPQKEDVDTYQEQEIGSGTGFIVSSDGLILTNKHVVYDEDAVYKATTYDGEEYEVEVLAKDPVQDLAVLKIKSDEVFQPIKLGDSDSLRSGQTVIAIGNALGEFENSVAVGVISGLGRTVTASGVGTMEVLEDVIQTDAAINEGNSGGPLLNLAGEVIGINTAISLSGQNIGFAIPSNTAKKDIDQVDTSGEISYPFLGVRYILVSEEVAQEEGLSVDYGALITGSEDEPAITEGSAAEIAGLKEGDIILEFGGEKVSEDNSLSKIISNYNPLDEVSLKILRDGLEETVSVTLGEWE